MIRYGIIALLALLLTACSHGSKTPSYIPPPVSPSSWTAYNSPGVSRCDDFTFGELHYCIKGMAISQGQVITMTFTTSGTGTIYPVSDMPPPRIALFLWRRGDDLSCAGPMQQYRYWSIQRPEIVMGTTQTLRVSVAPDQWTDCYGKPGTENPAAFAATLANLYAAGFSMGGASFAGHGDAARDGQVRFVLNSYSVGLTHKRKPMRRTAEVMEFSFRNAAR